MLSKLPALLTRWFDRSSPGISAIEPRIIPRDQHSISRRDLSRGAVGVLYDLKNAGHEAYLVGGCLRDLLTGSSPKDFDVVTSARPEEAHALLRRSRIIGRRFKLVHVRFGREIVEVATFRAIGGEDDAVQDRSHSDTGQILRDNIYGTIEEDALRRDFTINAIYYNIADFCLYDYAGGLADIKKQLIRLIGDPEQRYREDPVRMLRAVRFAAKLGFRIDPQTEAPIKKMASSLQLVPPARLFDEVVKVFASGHGLQALQLMETHGLLAVLFPELAEIIADKSGTDRQLLEAALENTDARLARDQPVTPAFLYAVMLWPSLRRRVAHYVDQGMSRAQAMHEAQSEVISAQLQTIVIPKRFSLAMREIWDLQARLERRHLDRLDTLMSLSRFRAAYDFLLLREKVGEPTAGAADWWTRYQDADEKAREVLRGELRGNRKGNGRRRRRRKPG